MLIILNYLKIDFISIDIHQIKTLTNRISICYKKEKCPDIWNMINIYIYITYYLIIYNISIIL